MTEWVRSTSAIALAALATTAAAANAAECPAGGATYRMEGTDRFEVYLARLAEPTAWTDLGLVLADQTGGRSWRFGLTSSNGYGLDSLVPDFELPEDAALHAFFFAAEEGYAGPARVPLPTAAGEAPDLIFVPDLGVTFWYDLPERVDLPTEMWVRTGCGRP